VNGDFERIEVGGEAEMMKLYGKRECMVLPI
jgi:hypothetical protein